MVLKTERSIRFLPQSSRLLRVAIGVRWNRLELAISDFLRLGRLGKTGIQQESEAKQIPN